MATSAKGSPRAKRRAGSRQVKKRALDVLTKVQRVPAADARRLAPRVADHLKGCSCKLCGNPRHFGGGSTMQERRATADDGDE